jgi:hypothetical protein
MSILNVVLSNAGELELDLSPHYVFLYNTTIPINWSCDEFNCSMGSFTILVNDITIINTDVSDSGSFNVTYGDKVTTTMNCGNCDQAMITINGANYYSAIGIGNTVTRDEYPITPMVINGTSYELITVNIGATSYSCVATIDLVINGGTPYRYTNYGGSYTAHTGDRIEAHLSGGTCDNFSIWIDGVDTGLSDYVNASATQNITIQGRGSDPLQIDLESIDTNCISAIGLYVNNIFIAQFSGSYGGTYWANSGDKVEAYLSGGTCYDSTIWINGVDTSSTHYINNQLVSTYINIQGIGQSLAPTVTTNTVGNISYTTASGGGNVTSQGSTTVTVRGICWSTSSNPTLADSHTIDGSGTGTFTSSMTGLTNNTLYYVRAYATNSIGTTYGDQETFNTLAATTTTTIAPTTTTTTTLNTPTVNVNSGITYSDNNITFPTIIQLNIFDLRYFDFKCFFNIKNKPVKFKVYSSSTLQFDSGYNGSKTYQTQLDSFLSDHGYPTENINDDTYQPSPMDSYYWETIFNIGGTYSSISVYVYDPLGGEWSFKWDCLF